MKKKNYLQMFQEGGGMPAPGPEGAPAGDGIDQMLMQVVETQDPQMALEFCNALAAQMGMAPEGPAPGGPAPEGPAPAEQMAPPMGRYGMKVPKIKL